MREEDRGLNHDAVNDDWELVTDSGINHRSSETERKISNLWQPMAFQTDNCPPHFLTRMIERACRPKGDAFE